MKVIQKYNRNEGEEDVSMVGSLPEGGSEGAEYSEGCERATMTMSVK